MSKLMRSTLIATTMVLFVSMVLSVAPAQAANFIVESLLDTGGTPVNCGTGNGCTLRQAINLANDPLAGPTTITFSVSGTITLGSTLLIDGNMIIDGTGQSVTVDGNGNRVLLVIGRLGLKNLTITNGLAGSGAGIYNQGVIFSIENSTFSRNIAFDPSVPAFGGGIYNEGWIETIANTTFSGNVAQGSGGGIYNIGTITNIANSTFYSNIVRDEGGGIYNEDSTITTIANTIVADSQGSNCGGTPAPGTNTNNLTDGDGCWSWSNTLIPGTHLNTNLADNGGPTQTHALLFTTPANPAIDTGHAGTCSGPDVNNLDQRGVPRPAGICDIGAYEYDSAGPYVTGNSLVASYNESGPSTFTVTYNENVSDLGGGSLGDDVSNPANYLLLEEGSVSGFQTASCAGGVSAGDSSVGIDTVSYSSSSYTSTVDVNGSAPLPLGDYRLFVCGTTSIVDIATNPLNDGADYTFDFSVNRAPPAALPATGFAPGRITFLPRQPTDRAYTSSDLVLEIPKLGVSAPIAGVPLVNGEWDVAWLGNNAGWLEGTAFPTYAGNTGITAHVWDADNNPGPFANLKNLRHGDVIKIHAWGYVYTYSVRYNYLTTPTNMNPLRHEEYDWVTLLTCERYSPTNKNYRFRRVVRAVLVDVSLE